MTAWDRDPASLGPRLEDVLRRKGADEGTDDAPLLTACLHWLEDRSRLSDVLSIGLANKGLLEHFLEVGVRKVMRCSSVNDWEIGRDAC